jgi:hypothetical protein
MYESASTFQVQILSFICNRRLQAVERQQRRQSTYGNVSRRLLSLVTAGREQLVLQQQHSIERERRKTKTRNSETPKLRFFEEDAGLLKSLELSIFPRTSTSTLDPEPTQRSTRAIA